MFRKSPKPEKAGKKPRVWDLGGNSKDVSNLERTRDIPEDGLSREDNIRPDTSVCIASSRMMSRSHYVVNSTKTKLCVQNLLQFFVSLSNIYS